MNSLTKAGLTLVILLLIVLGGFVIVPSLDASSHVIASSGTQIQIQNNLSFIPFTLSEPSIVKGSLVSNQNIGVYIASSNNIDNNLNPYSPPSEYLYFSGMSSAISFNVSVGKGTFYLIFFGTNQGSPTNGAIVSVTQSISFYYPSAN